MTISKVMWCFVFMLILVALVCVSGLEDDAVSRYIALNTVERAIDAYYPDIKKAPDVSVVLSSYRVDSTRGRHFMHIDATAIIRFSESGHVVCRKIQVRDVGEFAQIPDEARTMSGCG
ncbi:MULTISPECIES: hypothetical protein [Enterobacteriaceae]|uniref:Uncharacterized protein n=3 Tax=Enterobacteriaceae TaxID=543 RepID=A0AB38FZP4_9ENTR|nr:MULTISPECIES: hypothetical protein [Enterobacteriaceae]KFD23022.1 hypothetical protein GYRE_02552 [Yokenella regensburgei ATCC 49455]SQA64647.1 Uncharacterised protein [Yokenella regensburgei]SQA95727.1 Uncharacterised protein [Yokenella regensburgei]SUQ03851.1 Uncharacterised protein [Yokenella regensburgei]